uniref:Novel immune-type receptor 22 n=1 Tax=Oryzias latipes TaxID=8090 RepID=A0A3P9KB53_ORYLA
MQGGQITFILLCALSVTQSLAPEQVHTIEAETGSNVTLKCSASGTDQQLFFWHKLQFGYMIQSVATGNMANIALKKNVERSRFNVTKVGDVYSLFIRNVSKEDEAMYLCQAGASYAAKFTNSSQLVVKGPKKKQKVVKQSPDVELVLLGNTVNLQCSVLLNTRESSDECSDEHRVFWYKAGSEKHADNIYITNSSCDVQKERRCVYNLPKVVKNSSDSGVYYCAVLSRGEILFGNGTEVQIKKELCPYVIILGTLLTCSLLVTFSLILIRRKQTHVCDQCKETGNPTTFLPAERDILPETHLNNEQEVEGPEISYAALHFSRKTKWPKKKRKFKEESIYSTVRHFCDGEANEG